MVECMEIHFVEGKEGGVFLVGQSALMISENKKNCSALGVG